MGRCGQLAPPSSLNDGQAVFGRCKAVARTQGTGHGLSVPAVSQNRPTGACSGGYFGISTESTR